MRLHAELENDVVGPSASVSRLRVTEGLSELFLIDVELSILDPDLDLEALLGTPVSVRLISAEQGPVKQFHGLVEQAEYLAPHGDEHFLYRLQLRPFLHGLSHRVRTRVFQELNAPDIAKAVFEGAGFPAEAVRWKLERDYPDREFCLQYRESELDFVLRLLEDEGIYFRFVMEEGGHVLELLDSRQTLEPIEGDAAIAFSAWRNEDRELVADLLLSTRLHPDGCSLRDWDWKRPADALEASQLRDDTSGFERYVYPGGFIDTQLGGRRAHDRLQADGLARCEIHGRSNSARLVSGSTFDVLAAQPTCFQQNLLLTRVVWQLDQNDAALGRERFEVRFNAIPSSHEYRPPLVTPRPRVVGRETGVVCGPPGEEIHVDENGRIRVHFFWDREGPVDARAACWMRVQQLNTAGSMLLPRVGWEVEVGFLDGDPDRPVVLQKLYNQDTMPPYGLPGAKTQSSLQSSSSPGGGGTNELRMEDGSGGMQLGIHASRDLITQIGHDLSEHVTVNVSEQVGLGLQTQVGVDETIAIAGKQSHTVEGNVTDAIGGVRDVSVTGMDDWGFKKNATYSVEGDRTDKLSTVFHTLANAVNEMFAANHARKVGAALTLGSVMDIKETVAGKKTETIAGARLETIAKAKSESVAKSKTLTAAAMKVKTGENVAVNSKGPLAITAGGPWAEKCGEGFSIAGDTVKVVAAGGFDFKVGGTKMKASGGTLKLKASSLSVKGSSAVKLKGKINYKK